MIVLTEHKGTSKWVTFYQQYLPTLKLHWINYKVTLQVQDMYFMAHGTHGWFRTSDVQWSANANAPETFLFLSPSRHRAAEELHVLINWR
jgi:hypothetical protein